MIGQTYAQPVTVNGYTCRSCTDVDYAKKNIDPAHPKSGPFGVNSANDPTEKAKLSSSTGNSGVSRQAAVTFGGQLSGLELGSVGDQAQPKSLLGQNLDTSA